MDSGFGKGKFRIKWLPDGQKRSLERGHAGFLLSGAVPESPRDGKDQDRVNVAGTCSGGVDSSDVTPKTIFILFDSAPRS